METGKRLGVTVRVEALPQGIEGMHRGGELILNKNGKNPMAQTLAHELTHHLEQSGVYRDLRAYIEQNYAGMYGTSFAEAAEARKALYRKNMIELDDESAGREVVAQVAAEKLYTDFEAIKGLCNRNESLGQRILQHIQDLIVKLKGATEEKILVRSRQLYEKAMREVQKQGTTGQESSVGYSVETVQTDSTAARENEKTGDSPKEQGKTASKADLYQKKLEEKRLQSKRKGARGQSLPPILFYPRRIPLGKGGNSPERP
ncbi:MAG: hypothetical protein PHD67_10820 [Oscillospiraceae bacterium]|nr:hypothetical protein [Oscillospiraceae bacterium]